ncbi:MAG: transposase, partial [Singulisphaera sp.]|nr:transposase [Singulisphaera sp.]
MWSGRGGVGAGRVGSGRGGPTTAHFADADRLALRRERSAPLLERFGIWLEEQVPRVLPKSPMGQAIGYARSNWAALNRYLEAGFLPIDNNASERALKP